MSGRTSETALGFLVGVLSGATLALLFAPRPGEETRRRLRYAFEEMSSWLEPRDSREKTFANSDDSHLE